MRPRDLSTMMALLSARRLAALYGSESAVREYLRPREEWAAFRRLPLTSDEFGRIARNMAPCFR
jgi:hypothetical protein